MFTRSDVSDAIDDMHTTAKKTAKQVRGRAGEVMDDMRDRMPVLEDFFGRLAGTGRRLLDERPVVCLAAVGIAGILIGLSLRSRN